MTTLQATTDFTGTDGAAWPAAMLGAVSGALVGTKQIMTNTGQMTVGPNANFAGNDRASSNTTLGNAVTDAVVKVRFRYLNTATGGVNATRDNVYPSIWVRANSTMDSGAGYKVEFNPFSTAYSIDRVQAYGGTNTLNLATGTQSITTGSWYWVAFGVVGTSVQFMVWPDGSSQPQTWQNTITDSFITAGSVGLQAGKGDVASGVMQWDDFTVYSTFAEAIGPATGTVAGTATESSTITGQSNRRGTVTSTATASSAITGGTGASLTGVATGSSTVTGRSNRLGTVSSSVTASSTVTGIRGNLGSVSGTATLTASLTASRTDRGTVTGTATASSTVTASAALVAYGAVQPTATASSFIQASSAQVAQVTGEATASATISAGLGLYFITPTYRQHPMSRHPLIARTYISVGVTLLRFGTAYRTYVDRDPELVAQADKVYIGGHLYFIDFNEAADLTTAGYGKWLSADPPTSVGDDYQIVDYSQYGAGLYGAGQFGA